MEKFLTNRFLQIALLMALLLTAVSFSFSHARWRSQIRNFTFDNYNIATPRQSGDDIVIVDIDEVSLATVGQMPWPRNIMGQIVTHLSDMGARVIVFDMVFAEPDRSSPTQLAKQFEGFEGFEDITPKLARLKDNDAILGLAIGRAGNVVTGFSFTNEKTGVSPRQVGIFRGKDTEKFLTKMSGATINLGDINKFSAGNGSFFVSTDSDGIIRTVPMLIGYERESLNIVSVQPSLTLETIRVVDGEKGGRVLLADPKYAELDPNRFGVRGVVIGKDGRFIPTDAHGEFLVYFAKSSKDWYVSAHTVLDGTVDPEKIKDKIVFIATSAVGLKDIRSTPLNRFVPGVEVHLNIVDQILQEKFLTRPIEAEGGEAIAILLIGTLIIVLSSFVGALMQGALVILMIAGSIYGGWFAFAQYGLLIDVTYLSISLLSIFMLSTVLAYLRTEAARRQVRTAFGLYISPDFMRELTSHPDKLKLGGEIRELTVMFTDIRQFTGISETLSPEELIQLMNDFLTPMSDLVMHNRGTIDKYIGDAMMAFWNAPLDDPEHALHACRAALGMQKALEPINQRLEQRAKAQGTEQTLLRVGIGINTGSCAVGNMGSRQRFAYSALGDAVNVAARFESQTKTYGLITLVGEVTRNQVEGLAFLEIDLLQVKGKTVPEKVYTLLGDAEYAQSQSFTDWATLHSDMLETYRAQDFSGAHKRIKECIKADKEDVLKQVYNIYQERITELTRSPPAKDWNGVYKALTK